MPWITVSDTTEVMSSPALNVYTVPGLLQSITTRDLWQKSYLNLNKYIHAQVQFKLHSSVLLSLCSKLQAEMILICVIGFMFSWAVCWAALHEISALQQFA